MAAARGRVVGNITAKGAMLAVRPASLATASSGRMRVVIETSNPALARESVRALGGRVERSAAGLVQALVTPRAETRAGRQGRRRPRAAAVRADPDRRERRGGRRRARSCVAREGIHRQGRQGGRHRRRLQRPRRPSGGRRPSREHRHAGLLRRRVSAKRITAPRSRRSSTRWRPTRSCTSCASAPRSISPRPRPRRRARASP